jgi:hypothetical protein
LTGVLEQKWLEMRAGAGVLFFESFLKNLVLLSACWTGLGSGLRTEWRLHRPV